MSIGNLIKYRLRIGLLAVLLATLAGGLAVTTRAQGQICRDFGNLTVCGDEADAISLTGNLRIGPKGQPPVVRATAYPSDDPSEPEPEAIFIFGGSDTTGELFGSLELIGAPRAAPLVASRIRAIPGSINEFMEAYFIVDTVNLVIRNANAGEDPDIPAELRNHFYTFPFIDLAGLNGMTSDLSLEEFNQINAGFLLREREFRARLPAYMTLPGIDTQEPKTKVTLVVGSREDGSVGINIEDFQIRMLGMLGNLKSIKLVPAEEPRGRAIGDQAGGGGVQFEAEVLEFTRADNPDLPNLDPTKPDLVFSIQGVQFKDGRFSIRGGAVGLPDWQVGRAFKLTGQQVSLVTNAARTATTMVVSSTLAFPSGSALTDTRTFPMAIRIGLKELPGGGTTTGITGTLLTSARPALDLGPLTISTPAKTELIFDPGQNFFGLKADQVTVKWDSGLGGGSGLQSGLKLGVDKNKSLVFSLGAGGGISLPTIRSKALTVQVSGSIANTADLTTFTLTGRAQLALPGNGNVAPTVTMAIHGGKDVFDTCPPKLRCFRRFDYSLSRFEFKLAGFGIDVAGARGTGDGGFTVGSAKLEAPAGVTSIGGSIQGLTIKGDGNVSITGGSIELPPLQIGSFSLAGVKGSFLKTATGYEFKGVGTVPLPGLEPNSGKKITGEVVVRTRVDGSFSGFGVAITFNTGAPGIPIANTGMELTQLKGSFDINSGTVQISVGMRADTALRFGPVPAASVTGNALLQFKPFKMTANAELSVLFINVARASMGIGHQQGFSGGPGFNVSFEVNFILTHGETKLRVGPVTLSNGQRKTVIAAEATYTVGIKRSAIFPLMPPKDINVASLAFKGGMFTVKGKSETLGLLGRVKVSIPFLPDPSLSIFVDLRDGDVDVTDTDDYKLIGAAALRAQAAAGAEGFRSQLLAPAELSALGLDAAQSLLQETMPVTLDRAGMALFGISYPAGAAPQLRLRLPDGSVLTEQSVAEGQIAFLRETTGTDAPHELAFMLADARPGVYSLIIDGAPADYDTVSYMLNEEPTLADVAVSCGGDPAAGVTVRCDTVAAGSTATVSWTMQDADSSAATVEVGYAPLAVGVEGGQADLSQYTPIRAGLPAGAGSATWDLSDVPSGVYALVLRASDGQNAPVELVTAQQISVVDERAPAAPQGLAAESQPGELLVTWAPNPERDVAGYEIGFGVAQAGVADDPANFLYRRDMGPKETAIGGGDVYDAKLWGLTDDQEIFVGLRAYDLSGNTSGWSLLRARPWALSPEAWTPIPDGALPTAGAVEVAFATALDLPAGEALPGDLLRLLRADGSSVPGALTAILGPEGDVVVGLRFAPSQPLRPGATYRAVLKGGAAGLRSQAGRHMPEDYAWSFTAQQQRVFLPLVLR